MKRCPQCQRVYADLTLNFCLDDGVWLVESRNGESATAVLPGEPLPSEAPTRVQSNVNTAPTSGSRQSSASRRNLLTLMVASLGLFALAAVGVYPYAGSGADEHIDSTAVMPFANSSSDPDSEYISQGLAESLIYRLSPVPTLKVSPSSTVFRYKDKNFEPQQLGRELGVGAVLHRRITQRGDSLFISAELVDARNEKVLWGEQYDRQVIDPTLAEAHSALGVVLSAYEWNWEAAEQEFKKAIELNPNSENTSAPRLVSAVLEDRPRSRPDP